ncbi:MAG: response regulator [archaeon]
MKIMIVDDSKLAIAITKNFINKTGIKAEIIEAYNGKEAVEKYKSEKPTLVFMDIYLPEGIDGISALEEIKKIDQNAKVAMCTALKEKEHEARSKKAGCIGYIMKPIKQEDVAEIISKNF